MKPYTRRVRSPPVDIFIDDRPGVYKDMRAVYDTRLAITAGACRMEHR
jgi:hypothetical protein